MGKEQFVGSFKMPCSRCFICFQVWNHYNQNISRWRCHGHNHINRWNLKLWQVYFCLSDSAQRKMRIPLGFNFKAKSGRGSRLPNLTNYCVRPRHDLIRCRTEQKENGWKFLSEIKFSLSGLKLKKTFVNKNILMEKIYRKKSIWPPSHKMTIYDYSYFTSASTWCWSFASKSELKKNWGKQEEGGGGGGGERGADELSHSWGRLNTLFCIAPIPISWPRDSHRSPSPTLMDPNNPIQRCLIHVNLCSQIHISTLYT